MTEADLEQLVAPFKAEGLTCLDGPASVAQLAQLRGMYEPFVNGLADHFLLKLPAFYPERLKADNWQTSAWMPRTPGIRDLPSLERGDHFV